MANNYPRPLYRLEDCQVSNFETEAKTPYFKETKQEERIFHKALHGIYYEPPSLTIEKRLNLAQIQMDAIHEEERIIKAPWQEAPAQKKKRKGKKKGKTALEKIPEEEEEPEMTKRRFK